MIGHKVVAGLALLSALVFCAFAASSASAATSGQTAFTCVKSPDNKGDFKDAHCDETSIGTGAYTHVKLPSNPTTVTSTNAATQNKTSEAAHATLKSTLGGLATEITCKTLHGHGSLENKLSGEWHWEVASGTTNLSNCTMPKPLKEGKERCKVKEPIEFEATATSTEKGKAMGLLVSPKAGKVFVGLTFEEGPGAGCPIAGKTLNVEGTAEATSSLGAEAEGGATLEFTNAMTKGAKCETAEQTGLCVGGSSAEFQGVFTIKMLSTTGGTPENAIALTTPPFSSD